MSESTNTTPAATQQAVAARRLEARGRKAVAKQFKSLERLKIEYLPIEAVTPNEYNPNRQSEHDFELLLRSMEEDGFTQPIIVNLDGRIVDGEHRWRAAKTLGLTEVPIVRVDMSPEQMRISTIRHNRARGSHDLELEAQVLRDLQALGALEIAQDSLMLDDVELNRMINDIAAPEAFAGEEYSEAWVPDTFTDEEAALLRDGAKTTEAVTRHAAGGGELQAAMTAAAIEQQRRREELLKRAKTEEERKAVREETRIYRVSLIFTDEEADVVKAVLGARPAERLLGMCRERAGGVS